MNQAEADREASKNPNGRFIKKKAPKVPGGEAAEAGWE
jgi:hypothetical protein